ncbi:MAG: hypothetical protein V2A73_11900 [Pseudomonadota bacterium]
MSIKAIETDYKGYRFRSAVGVRADTTNPYKEVRLRHIGFCSITHPTARPDIAGDVAKGTVNAVDAAADVLAVGAANPWEHTTRHSAAVVARLFNQDPKVYVRQLESVASLTGALAVEDEQLTKGGFARGQTVMAGLPPVVLSGFSLETPATTRGTILKIGPDDRYLLAAVALAAPNPMPRPALELLADIPNDYEPPKTLASMFHVRFAHKTPPIERTHSIQQYGRSCQTAARSA